MSDRLIGGGGGCVCALRGYDAPRRTRLRRRSDQRRPYRHPRTAWWGITGCSWEILGPGLAGGSGQAGTEPPKSSVSGPSVRMRTGRFWPRVSRSWLVRDRLTRGPAGAGWQWLTSSGLQLIPFVVDPPEGENLEGNAGEQSRDRPWCDEFRATARSEDHESKCPGD